MQVLESKQDNRTARERQRNAFKRRLSLNESSSHTRQPFIIWCPTPTLGRGLAATIHALYYLPENFLLLLPHTGIENEEIPMIIEASPLANRVRFYPTEGSSDDEPSSVADAVICSERRIVNAPVPVVVVSTTHGGLMATERGYRAGASPEAIASALLCIARNQGMAE